MPGFEAITLASIGLERALDHGRVKEKANEIKAVILTRDKDYLDQIRFRICTHPGVVWLRFPHSDLGQERVRTFLSSKHKLCRHAVIQLYETYVYVQDRPGGPVKQLPY